MRNSCGYSYSPHPGRWCRRVRPLPGFRCHQPTFRKITPKRSIRSYIPCQPTPGAHVVTLIPRIMPERQPGCSRFRWQWCTVIARTSPYPAHRRPGGNIPFGAAAVTGLRRSVRQFSSGQHGGGVRLCITDSSWVPSGVIVRSSVAGVNRVAWCTSACAAASSGNSSQPNPAIKQFQATRRPRSR